MQFVAPATDGWLRAVRDAGAEVIQYVPNQAFIVAATPLVFAAIGELVVERAGVLNLGVEGMMIVGAIAGFAVTIATGSYVLGIVAASRSEPVLVLRDRALLSIPVLGGLIERRSTAQLARTLATLIRNGVPMLDALDVCAGVLANRCYRAAIRQAERELNEGKSIAAPLQRSGLFPEVALRLIQVGEQSGQLEIMLVRVAEIFEHDVRTRLQRLIGLMAPILTLAIGALVGGLILSVMGAILSINDLALK